MSLRMSSDSVGPSGFAAREDGPAAACAAPLCDDSFRPVPGAWGPPGWKSSLDIELYVLGSALGAATRGGEYGA